MRFCRVISFILMLVFSYNAFADVSKRPLQVSTENITFSGTPQKIGTDRYYDEGLGLTEGEAAAMGGLMGLGTGSLLLAGAMALGPVGWVAAGVVGLGAAIVGLGTYLFAKPKKCSFNDILSSFQSLSHGSWLSPVFNMLFNTINQLAVAVNSVLGGKVINILAIMLAFYIVFTASKHIVSFAPVEPVKLVSEIFFPLGRTIIAVLLIKEWSYVFHEVLSPILDLAINLGVEIMSSQRQSSVSYRASVGSGAKIVYGACSVTNPGTGLDKTVCDSIQTFLGTISSTLVVWMAFGATLIVDCFNIGWDHILPRFDMFFVGLIIFVFTFLVYLSFPLKLLDAMFRLMFIIILFPLWCAFWVVPQTREYFKKMIGMLVNVMATFLSASVILVIVSAILANLFNGIPLEDIVKLLQEGKSEKAMEKIGFSTSTLFYSTCLLFMAFHLVGKVDYFANIFNKQDSLGMGSGKGSLGEALTGAIAGTPKVARIGKNMTKWGVGKVASVSKWGAGKAASISRWGADKAKEGWGRHNAKSYNKEVPGGTARKSPRLWTAPIPGTGLWDAHQAKKAIGGFAQTKDVSATGVKVAEDGSTTQTYSNKTVDKNGNVMAQMKETATSNADKSKQSVDRQTTRFDQNGGVRKVSNVKKDFQNGKAVRKSTTMTGKDGSKVNLLVDKVKGIASSTKFGANGKKISETVRDLKSGLKTITNFGADGKKISEEIRDKNGLREKTTFGSNGQKSSQYKRLMNGSETTTFDSNGNAQRTVSDFTQSGKNNHFETDFEKGTRNFSVQDGNGNILESHNETRMSDGTVMQHHFDKAKGTESTNVVDRQEGDYLGLHDRVLASQVTDSHTGNTTTKRYNPDTYQLQTEEVKGHDGSASTTTYHDDGMKEHVLTNAQGQETARSWTRQDGSKQTTRYEHAEDGSMSGFTTIDKDASGNVTRDIKVDLKHDAFTDRLTGTTGKWSEHNRSS